MFIILPHNPASKHLNHHFKGQRSYKKAENFKLLVEEKQKKSQLLLLSQSGYENEI